MKGTSSQSLQGLTIGVTRPEGQSQPLCEAIDQAGGIPVRLPLLEILPVDDSAAAEALLGVRHGWDWLIFISANAAQLALGSPRWDAEPDHRPKIAAIGPATAAVLEQAGWPADLVAPPPYNSESLLTDPRLQFMQGERVLIVRGEGGREYLAERLRERGAEIHYAELYRRVAVPAEQLSSRLKPWREAGLDAIIVSSGESLERLNGLREALGWQDPSATPTLVVAGERVAGLARDQGWHSVLVAEAATDEAILAALTGLEPRRPDTSEAVAADEENPSAEPSQPSESESTRPDTPPPETSPSDDQQSTEEDTPLADQELETAASEESAEGAASRSPEEPAREDEPAAAAETPTRSDEKPRNRTWLGYLFLILILVVLVGGWLLLQKLRSSQTMQEAIMPATSGRAPGDEPGQRVSALQSEVAALHSQMASVQSKLATEDSKLERIIGEQGQKMEEHLKTTRGELSGAVQQIQRQLSKTRGDVLIADAEYLLNIANQKLHLVGDVKSVLAAMEAADQRLHESGDPVVYKVRAVLAEEISMLRRMNAPDIVGLSARLIAIEKKAAELPLILPHAGKIQGQPKAKTDGDQADDQGDAIDHAWEEIKDLVTVRRADVPIEAMLTPEQAELMRQILLLRLETTRAALLRNDENLFKDSLTAAIDWVNEHFELSNPETGTVVAELKDLLNHSLGMTLPDISHSMVMLQNIEKLRLEAEDRRFQPDHDQVKPVGPEVPAPTDSAPLQPAVEEAAPAPQPLSEEEESPQEEAPVPAAPGEAVASPAEPPPELPAPSVPTEPETQP